MSARILAAIIGGFCAGVFIRSFVFVPYIQIGVALGAVALLLVAGFFIRRCDRYFFLAAVAFGACALGVLRMDAAVLVPDALLESSINAPIELSGVVIREPDVREKNIRLTVDLRSAVEDGVERPVRGRVMMSVPAHSVVAYGDKITLSGKIRRPESFDSGLGRSFNYPMYLAVDGILYEMSFAKILSREEGHGNPLQSAAIVFKQKFIEGLDMVLPEPYAGLAGGITVGDKRSVGKDLTAVFQQVSLVHVLVLSGYNITIVINFLARLLVYVPRRVSLCLQGAAVVFIVLIAGGAASATRAGAMALLAVYARNSGRLFFALRVLSIVAAAMVLWNPYVLAFDPGFQLSVLATLGLVVFTPAVAHRLTWITERVGLREIVASTIATQITVLPLLLYSNGLLSIVALPANMLALIAVPPAMFASISAAIVGMIAGSHAVFVALPAYLLLSYIVHVAEFFASLPFASVALPAFSAWWLVLMYGILFGGYAYIQKKTTELSSVA